MTIKQKTNNRSVERICALAAFSLVILLGQARNAPAQQWTTNGSNINNTNTGNVGVGTTNPTSPLEIQAADGPLTLSQAGVTGKVTLQAAIGTDLHLSANAKYGSAVWNRFDTARPSWNIFLSPSADYVGIRRSAAGAGAITWTDFLRITNNGYVGIGITNPAVPLHLNSPAAAYTAQGQFHITDSANTNRVVRFGYDSTLEAGWIQASKVGTAFEPLLLNPNGGNIGIGTASPQRLLQLHSSANTVLQVTDSTSGSTPSDGLQLIQAGVNSFVENQEAGLMAFRTSAIDRMTITSVGNVGIGTTAPAAKLHVAGDGKVTGNLTVDGNIAAKYQDVAEWVPSSYTLSPGTVVIIDPTKSNEVIASSEAYDTRVAGVISAQPGLTLGESGEGKVLVATTGRLRVKVDAGRGPIRVGDLLVTSGKEGVAMKSEPLSLGGTKIHRPGTLIGKALEPLAKGTGEILVLLSLQ